MKKVFLMCFTAVCLFIVVGCGSKSISREDKAALRTIAISTDFIIQPEGRIVSVFGGGPLLGGALGELLRDKSPDEILWHTLTTDNMLGKVITESFRYQFSRAGTWEIVPAEAADVHLYVQPVILQAVWQSGGYKLVGSVRAELRNRSGATIWSDSDQITAFNGTIPKNPLPLLMTDKTKLANALSIFSQLVAGDMVESLGGNRSEIRQNLADGQWDTAAKATATSEDKLRATKELFEKGLITEEDYKRKKQDIIDKM